MSGSLLAAYRTATPASSHQRHLRRGCVLNIVKSQAVNVCDRSDYETVRALVFPPLRVSSLRRALAMVI